MRLLDADAPTGEFREVLPRKTDVEYEVSHRGDHLFLLLRTPQKPNSELLVAPVADPTRTTVRQRLIRRCMQAHICWPLLVPLAGWSACKHSCRGWTHFRIGTKRSC